MRVTGAWFHRSDCIFSSDAEMVATLRSSIFKAVPQSDDQIYNSTASASHHTSAATHQASPTPNANNNNQQQQQQLPTNNNIQSDGNGGTFYSITYGEGCDAIKVAVVPIALKKNEYAAFACVGASDGFSVATLVSIARRMGNAIRLLIPPQDFDSNTFRNNKLEIRAVLSFTRRSLSEPDLIHGALSEAQVKDCIFDNHRPKFASVAAVDKNGNNNKDVSKTGTKAGGGKKDTDTSPNAVVLDSGASATTSTSTSAGARPLADDELEAEEPDDDHSLKFWSADRSEKNPVYEVRWIRGLVLCGNYVINSFEDSSIARSCQTTSLGWDGFLYLARAMAAFGCDRKLMEHATHLENEMTAGEDIFRHLKLFRDDVLHTVELNENSRKEIAEQVPLEERTAMKVSTRNPRSACDCTATTGELLRELDSLAKEIKNDFFCGVGDDAVDKTNSNQEDEKNPELTAMLEAIAARFDDAPKKYEKFANAVHSSNCVDSLLHWGEAETKGFGFAGENSNNNNNNKNANNQEQQEKSSTKPKLSTDRPALHYKVRCADERLEFWISFKFVSFGDTATTSDSATTTTDNDDPNREKTSSDGYSIAVFSFGNKYGGDEHRRPINARYTSNGFPGALDEVVERMVQTAQEERSLDTDIWSKIRSGRAGEIFFEKLSPHVMAIDVVDRSCLLDALNARILFNEFEDDIICSRLVPRLVRRSPILESIDKDEKKGSTNVARKQALQELMDTFRRSICRAHQMFASGSVEGMWSTAEGAFFHGLFLTRATKQQFYPLPSSSTLGNNINNNNNAANFNVNNLVVGNNNNNKNNTNVYPVNAVGGNNNNNILGYDGGMMNNNNNMMMGDASFNDNNPNQNNNGNNNNNQSNNNGASGNDAVALIAAPLKYLNRLPFGCLVPAASSMIPAGTGNMGAGQSGSWTNISSTNLNSNTGNNSENNNNANSSQQTEHQQQQQQQDVPMARLYFSGKAPSIVTHLKEANESLPLGLLEVHCMFTPNTDIDQMPSEVYYALSQMHAFS